jgi:hypothetical protein
MIGKLAERVARRIWLAGSITLPLLLAEGSAR